jgi:hypothetical protein
MVRGGHYIRHFFGNTHQHVGGSWRRHLLPDLRHRLNRPQPVQEAVVRIVNRLVRRLLNIPDRACVPHIVQAHGKIDPVTTEFIPGHQAADPTGQHQITPLLSCTACSVEPVFFICCLLLSPVRPIQAQAARRVTGFPSGWPRIDYPAAAIVYFDFTHLDNRSNR